MSTRPNKKINIILGKLKFSQDSNRIFDGLIIDFLNNVSTTIRKNKFNLSYSDLIAFGFWCRKSNLLKLSEKYNQKYSMLGRGTVLHITPSNVPMNFAYSLVFGLLSGNNNIVRLPSRSFIQVNILCKIFSKILKTRKYASIQKNLCFVKYNRSDEISSELSRNVDARVIWGGDETINQFKKYYTSPRCIDLTFSNRYSISIIDSNKISELKLNEIRNLAYRFYNDCYIMDQQGCSSPQAIFWLGEKNNSAKKTFWDILSKIVNQKYENDLSVANKKISSLSHSAVATNLNFKTNYKNFKLIRLNIKNPSKEIEKIQCHFGTFIEINIKKINELKKFISKRFQTVTCYGVEQKNLENFILNNGIAGVDRIVPIGRAFDIGPIWDGYDIIYSLSRIIGK